MNEKEYAIEVLKAKAFDTIHILIEDMWDIIDRTPDEDNERIVTLGAIYGVVANAMEMIETLQNGE